MHLCLFTSSFSSFSLALSCQKKKMLLLIFVHLILSTPLQNVSHVVFLTLKKIILCFYTSQLTGALFFFLHCQTSRKQYALPIFTASSLTDTSAPCKLNFLLSLSHSLKCPRYISFVPKFSALLPQSYFPTISLLHLVLLKVHAFGNTSLCLDDTSASLIALFCLFWFFCLFFVLLNSPLPSLVSSNADSLQGSTYTILPYLFQLSTSPVIICQMFPKSQVLTSVLFSSH